MKLQKNQKKKLSIGIRCLYLVLILLPLLVTATYTWFSLSRTPKVSEMSLSVDSGTGLELAFSYDSEEWTQHIDYSEIMADYAPLKPVTWSEANQSFYAAEYGIDGRIAHISQKLSDELNANRGDVYGYYIKNTFYARTGEPVRVSLAPAVVGADGTQGAGTYVIGTPVWNEETIQHDNGGYGAESAVRIGFRITKLNADGTPSTQEAPIFYIYEPNYNSHAKGHSEALETYWENVTHKDQEGDTSESQEGTVGDATAESEQTHVNSTHINAEDPELAELFLIDTPSIDGTATLVPQERLIRQSFSTWQETYPIQKGVIVQRLGEFYDDTFLFELEPNGLVKIEMYIWLEGQDVDCDNRIGYEAQLFANVQFQAIADTGTGLEEINKTAID